METVDVSQPARAQLPRPPRSLRLLHAFLWVAAGVLTVVSLVTVFVVGRALLGDAPIYEQGRTGEVTIEHMTPAGQTVVQTPGPVTLEEYPNPRFLYAGVQVQLDSGAAKAIAALEQLVIFAFAWFGLVQMLRLVRSALSGAPFATINARRIERLGWAAVFFPFVSWFVGRSLMMEAVDDAAIGVSGFLPGASGGFSPTWIAIGLLLVGLGWVFRWGADLAAFEQAVV